MLLLADLVNYVKAEFRHCFVVLYADDILIAHRHLGATQHAVHLVTEFLRGRGLEINTRKTKAVKFRRGGRLAKSDEIICGGQPLEFFNTNKYLGLRVHYTGANFSAHIEERVAAALSAAHARIKDV